MIGRTLGVRIVGRLEPQAVDTHFAKEDFHKANEAAKRQTKIGNDYHEKLDLMFPLHHLQKHLPPSTWWNSARWVASTVSFRNTRSIEKYRAGRGFAASLCSIFVLVAVV